MSGGGLIEIWSHIYYFTKMKREKKKYAFLFNISWIRNKILCLAV